MWLDTLSNPIPTHDANGKEFLLTVVFHDYYGYTVNKHREIITGVWDSLCECFFEKKSNLMVRDEDIIEWWLDDKS